MTIGRAGSCDPTVRRPLMGAAGCRLHELDSADLRRATRNLIPLCKKHGCHTKYHEGGWTLEIDTERNITITRPDGTIHYQGPSIYRAPNGVAAE